MRSHLFVLVVQFLFDLSINLLSFYHSFLSIYLSEFIDFHVYICGGPNTTAQM